MIRIDDTLLEEIGLIALPKADRDQLLKQIYETLEMRVGMRLAERMSDQQLDEFERFIDTNDEAGALKWLESNFPDYKQVVASELDKLKSEIKQDSSKIMEAMKQSASAQAPQMEQSAGAPSVASQSPAGQQTFEPAPPTQPQPNIPSQQPPQSFHSFPQPQAGDDQSTTSQPSSQPPTSQQPWQQQATSQNDQIDDQNSASAVPPPPSN